MIISFERTRGYVLQARDGELGRCKDFLFDDETWTVRYMVADTRKWLPGRKVLLSPQHLNNPNWSEETLPVDLTRQQIKDSPHLDEDAPVSRLQERRWADFFGHRYWPAAAAWGPISTTPAPTLPVDASLYRPPPLDDPTDDESVHVRSCREMIGYAIRTPTGSWGRVSDVLIDTTDWRIMTWIIEAPIAGGATFELSVAATRAIDWKGSAIQVRPSSEELSHLHRLSSANEASA